MKKHETTITLLLWVLAIFTTINLSGCATHTPKIIAERPVKIISPRAKKELPRMGYTIQVGAFAKIENAARLTRRLKGYGLSPYYFRQASGLYKVRFGNFSSLTAAKNKADYFFKSIIISDYYLVKPESYATSRDDNFLRQQLVSTADNFIGIPYKWGGESAKVGFDCSGLTMAVYKLNGLNLPRNSRSQFKAGRPVEKDDLQKGDLVFFATNGGKRITHVGMYIGNNNFIHAPKTGKKIRYASLDNSYFKARFMGGRTYL